MQKFVRNQHSLSYERLGRGAPLVLIHGYPLDHSIWKEVTPLLSSTFDLILPDVRGFGQSDATDSPYSMADLANDLAALLDHLQIESVFVAGHSMGGYVSLAFAQAHPSRVNGLALVASQAAADTPERRASRHASVKQILEHGIEETVEGMTPKLSANTRVQAFVHELMAKQKPAAFIGALQAMAGRLDMLPYLVSSNFPLLLIHGDSDGLIPLDRAREIKAAVPRAGWFLLPGVGHMPMLEDPTGIAIALKTFI